MEEGLQLSVALLRLLTSIPLDEDYVQSIE
jgi:hypothetical protein